VKRFLRSPAIWLILLLFTNTAFGDEDYFYPGQGSSADNASFRMLDPRGLAFLGYLSGWGDFSQSITGGLGFELRQKFSSIVGNSSKLHDLSRSRSRLHIPARTPSRVNSTL